MDLIYWFGLLMFVYYIFYILVMISSDRDVETIYAEYLGKSLNELQGKVIWITGASSGIGEHLAISCAEVGSKLVLSARRANELERVKKACLDRSIGKLNNSDIMILSMDVLDLDSHQDCFRKVINHFGKLDILVNNAGRSQRALFEDIEMDVDRSIFELNVFSVINLTRICIRYFTERGEGHVAVTSSCTGIIGAPYSASYTATKHALHGYFNSLRAEKLGQNITVTIVCPGPTFTHFLEESFTSKTGDKYGQSTKPNDRRLAGEKCGHFFAVALANKMDESWFSPPRALAFYYLFVYYRNILKIAVRLFGLKNILKLRDSN